MPHIIAEHSKDISNKKVIEILPEIQKIIESITDSNKFYILSHPKPSHHPTLPRPKLQKVY